MARHAELARALSAGIAAGRYPVGSLLPTEFELCEQWQASRYTVRMALQQLQDAGLISRRKNVGTRVEAQRPTPGFTQSIATVDELAQFGATHTRVVQSIEPVVIDTELARQLGCAGGLRRLRISFLRLEGGKARRPIAWTDAYIDPAYEDVTALLPQRPEALIGTLIEERHGRRVARLRQAVTATALPAALAEPLRAAPDSPALRVVRHYLDETGEAFEITQSWHPADRFTFTMEVARAKA